MPAWFAETLKDPIFQLAAVVFIAALAMFFWMIFQYKKSGIFSGFSDGKPSDSTGGTAIKNEMPLSQEAKFQLVLENVIAINRRLDDIEKRLSSNIQRASTGAASQQIGTSSPMDPEISRKLDAIYKILSALSTKSE